MTASHNTVNCYVPTMLAQGEHKWPGFPNFPFYGVDVEFKDINYDVYWRFVEMCALTRAVLTLDDRLGLRYAKRLARGLEY